MLDGQDVIHNKILKDLWVIHLQHDGEIGLGGTLERRSVGHYLA